VFALFTVLLAARMHGGLKVTARTKRPFLQATRGVLLAVQVVVAITSFAVIGLAHSQAIFAGTPLLIALLSMPILGERVGWRRWSAVLCGFVGVVIALRPSTAMLTWPALIAIAGSMFFATLMITTRMLRGTADIVLVTGQIAATFLFGLIAAPFAWVPPTALDVGLMAILGLVAMTALACVNRSLKLSPASVVAPYQYTMIVWAIALGFLVFGDLPDAAMLAGSAIIIAAGLYILWREQIVTRRDPAMAPPPA
jgi:drug/metabolite transporter (DMT)-like permease